MGKLVLICLTICYLTIVNCGETCDIVLEKGVKINDEIKKEILDKHNDLRSLIVSGSLAGWPQGINLFVIGWDDKLAKEAQRRIELLCQSANENPSDDRFPSVGQIRSVIPGSGSNFEGVIQSWFDQHKQYEYPTFPTGFAQIVKNETQYVGCGLANYHTTSKPDQTLADHLCLYGPGVRYPYHDGSPTYTPLDINDKIIF